MRGFLLWVSGLCAVSLTPQFMKVGPIKKSNEALSEMFVAPLKGYKPKKVVEDDDTGEGFIMDKTAESRGNFGKWMKKHKGFHYDKEAKRFVHD